MPLLWSLIACGNPSGNEPDELCEHAFYADADKDGHGNATAWTTSCQTLSGYVETSDDCDDTVPSVHPGAEEICNDVDDDCDGSIDVGAVDATMSYVDRDGDGLGADATPVTRCGTRM